MLQINLYTTGAGSPPTGGGILPPVGVPPVGVQVQLTSPCPQAIQFPAEAEFPQVTHFCDSAAGGVKVGSPCSPCGEAGGAGSGMTGAGLGVGVGLF